MPGESEAGASGSHGGSEPTPAGGDFAALAPDLTRRIGTILDAVQREADKMLDEARGEAQRHVEVGKRQADGLLADRQRRIAALSDTLIERTEAVVAQLEETALVRDSFGRLLRALSAAADEVTTEVQAAPVPPPPAPEPPAVAPSFEEQQPFAATAPAPPSQPEVAPEPPPAAQPPADRAWVEARQAAIQMAAAGNTRAQVEAHLRGFLHVADPAPLLDQVFGAATAGEARVPWAIVPSAPPAQPENAGG